MRRLTHRAPLGGRARAFKLAGLLALAALAVAVIAMSAAAATSGGRPAGAFPQVDRAEYQSVDRAIGVKFTPRAMLSSKPTKVIVQLKSKPVAAYMAAAKRSGVTLTKQQRARIRAAIKRQQALLKRKIHARGGRVSLQFQDAYNGMVVRAKMRSLPKIARLPGVKALRTLRTFQRENERGDPFIGAPVVWSQGITGNEGNQIRVGVIDTGVDYTHADFGGPGTVEAFEAADASDTDQPDPTLMGPLAPKVKAGYDFVGDEYNASSDDPAKRVPHPDPDPLDCNGHGTHVAGTIAGFGVLANGQTYHGPYDASTIGANNIGASKWRMGPGVAPGAWIHAYRVFGCAGSTSEEVMVQAIDRAVQDGVHVINMSIGSPFGREDEPSAAATNNASLAGVSVVMSAGNSGPNAYITGAPAVASRGLSVAAMDAVPSFPGANINFEVDGHSIPAINANAEPLPSGAHQIRVLRTSTGAVSLGCNPAEYAGSEGKIVVVVRGVCARVARAIYGQKAGAVAVVMINTSTAFPPFEGKIRENPDTGEKFRVTIPFLGVRGVLGPNPTDDGDHLVSHDGTNATLTATQLANPAFTAYASFTSGGPRNPDSALKPEITAPGVSVASAAVGTGNEESFLSGTSMASPMTAGATALVREAHPTWSPQFVKAALMNTADPTSAHQASYNPRLGGAGVVQVDRAVATNVVAITPNNSANLTCGSNCDALNSLSFGYVPGQGTYVATKTIRFVNMTSSAQAYTLSVTQTGSQIINPDTFATSPTSNSPVSITPSPGAVVVPPNSTSDVAVTLSIPKSAFAGMPYASTFLGVGPGALYTVRGNVFATPSGGNTAGGTQTLHVPYLVVPRGLSNIVASARAPYSSGSEGPNTSSVTVTNTPDAAHASDADFYAWGISDREDVAPTALGDKPMDIRAAGVQVLPREALCGTTPAGRCGTSDDRSLVFAVNNWGRWSNASVNEFDIAIDTDNNRDAEFFVVGVDIGAVLAGSFDGRFGSIIINADTGRVVNAWFADAPMNGSTVLLPTLASDVGLSRLPTNGTFNYWVTGFNLFPGDQSGRGNDVDVTTMSAFSAFRPSVTTGQFVHLAPGESETVPFGVNSSAFGAQLPRGLMIVTLDDANGAPQADLVSLGLPFIRPVGP